jgi:hypothetical protein
MKQAMSQPESVLKTYTNGNFFSTGLRQKVDQLMDILWAGGMNNPRHGHRTDQLSSVSALTQ